MFRRTHRTSLPLLALLAIAGCSVLPTAPALEEASEPQPSIVVAQETKTTKVLNGLVGGIVTAGDFTVVFPPLAFEGIATVTVSQRDREGPVVDLSISPASANRFLVPVTLIANVAKMDAELLPEACLSYYNPATGAWEPVAGSTVDVASLTLQAPLTHFSTYRVESGTKAGW